MKKISKILAVAAAGVLLTNTTHAEPDPVAKTMFENLMSATASNNYDAFIAECDAVMKAALTKPMLEGVSQQIKPRVKKGYEARYLGELNQRGHQVHLWRLIFKDGGDDVLATLSIKDGRAGGFYLH